MGDVIVSNVIPLELFLAHLTRINFHLSNIKAEEDNWALASEIVLLFRGVRRKKALASTRSRGHGKKQICPCAQVRGAINPGRPPEGGEGVHAGGISDRVLRRFIRSAKHGADLAASRGVRDGQGLGGRGFQCDRSRAVDR